MNIFKNNHANQRYFERVSPDMASKKDIVKAIQNPKNIQYIKKLTESRSTAYVHLPNNNIVKIIINKNKKEIVTILPWHDVYHTTVVVPDGPTSEYIVELYPDCYIDTKRASVLNKVRKIYEDFSEENISFNLPIFDQVITSAFEIHRNGQNYEENCAEEKA